MSKTITSGFGSHKKLTICYSKTDDTLSITQNNPFNDNPNIKIRGDCIDRFLEVVKEVMSCSGRG